LAWNFFFGFLNQPSYKTFILAISCFLMWSPLRFSAFLLDGGDQRFVWHSPGKEKPREFYGFCYSMQENTLLLCYLTDKYSLAFLIFIPFDFGYHCSVEIISLLILGNGQFTILVFLEMLLIVHPFLTHLSLSCLAF
jgi:hypothetical protein